MYLQVGFRFVLRWFPLLLVGTIIGAGGAYLAVRQVPSVYESTATLLVGQAGPGSEDSQQAIGTYASLLTSSSVIEAAVATVPFGVSVRDLQERVSVSTVRDTQLLKLSVEDTSPENAAALANAIARVFANKTDEMQSSRYASSRENLGRLVQGLRQDLDAKLAAIEALKSQPASLARDTELARFQSEASQLQVTYSSSVQSFEELRITEARNLNTVQLVEPALAPDGPIRPQRLQLVLLGAAVGLLLSVSGAALYDYLDDRLRTPRRVIAATGLLSLGSIPQRRAGEPNNPFTGSMDRRLAESYRLLYRNLSFAMGDSPLRTVMVSSAGIGEGKSTTAAHLAIVLAQAGQKVTLIDADLHRPSQSRIFDLPARVGLSTLLLDTSMKLEDALQPTQVSNLRILAAGPVPADPSALLASRRWSDRVEELDRLGDLVIIDTPPLLAQPDAALVASRLDAVLLVVDARKTRASSAATAIEMLRDAGAVLQGVVLNRATRRDPYVDYSSAGAEEATSPNGRPVAMARTGGQQ